MVDTRSCGTGERPDISHRRSSSDYWRAQQPGAFDGRTTNQEAFATQTRGERFEMRRPVDAQIFDKTGELYSIHIFQCFLVCGLHIVSLPSEFTNTLAAH